MDKKFCALLAALLLALGGGALYARSRAARPPAAGDVAITEKGLEDDAQALAPAETAFTAPIAGSRATAAAPVYDEALDMWTLRQGALFEATIGEDVLAPASGVVSAADEWLELTCAGGLVMRLYGLEACVAPGAEVVGGDAIGKALEAIIAVEAYSSGKLLDAVELFG